MRCAALLLLMSAMAIANQAIPEELRKRIKTVQSFHDLMNMATVMYKPRNEPQALTRGSNSRNAHHKIKIKGASFVALASVKRDDTAEHHETEVNNAETQADMSILSTIRQGNDTCQLQSICVPVPIENANPEILIFPRCYQVTQCVGSCCDAVESCHPTAIEYLQKPVVEMVYSGNNKFVINQTLNITMEQHLACSCRDCNAEGAPPTCRNGRVIGASCTCECKNQMDKSNCAGNRRWNEEECTCYCPIRVCPRNRILNTEACACEQSQQIRLRIPDENGNFKTDTSKLPRLRPKFENRHRRDEQ